MTKIRVTIEDASRNLINEHDFANHIDAQDYVADKMLRLPFGYTISIWKV